VNRQVWGQALGLNTKVGWASLRSEPKGVQASREDQEMVTSFKN
jgi:hypothetical protein